MNIMVHVNVNS